MSLALLGSSVRRPLGLLFSYCEIAMIFIGIILFCFVLHQLNVRHASSYMKCNAHGLYSKKYDILHYFLLGVT